MNNAEDLLSKLCPLVRQNLQQSGHLVPAVFVQSAKGLQIVGVAPASLGTESGKQAVVETIRKRVADEKARLVLLVAEAWAAEIEPVEADLIELGAAVRRAKDRQNRREVVTVNAQTKDSVFSGTADITRDTNGKPDVSVEPPHLNPATTSMRFFR